MSNNYFIDLGYIELGNTDRLISWIKTIESNVHKMFQYAVRTEIKTDLNLDRIDQCSDVYLNSSRYGINFGMSHFMFRGPILKPLFDDWDSVFNQITSKVGPCDFDFPAIVYTPSHVFRHNEYRKAALNIGLYNSEDSCNLYWDGRKLVGWHNMNYSEAVLMRVTDTYHSMVQDDRYGGFTKPRAVLSFDVSTPFLELKEKYDKQ